MKKFSLLFLFLTTLSVYNAFSGGADDPVYLTFSGRVYGYNTTLSVGESFSLRIRSVGTCENYRYNTVSQQWDLTSTINNVVVDAKNILVTGSSGSYGDHILVWYVKYIGVNEYKQVFNANN